VQISDEERHRGRLRIRFIRRSGAANGPHDPRQRQGEADGAGQDQERGWQERRHDAILPRMSTSRLVPILSDALIDAALRRAERKVCAPGDPRCYGFPYTVEDALRSMTPDGWCRIGWVAARSGRDEWEVWFHLDRGEVRTA
jgi:hypothetical protein